MHDIPQQDRNLAFLIFGLLLACYLLTYTGRIDSSDGLAMFATAESMVRRGEIDSNQLLWMGNQQGNLGPDGDLYSRKGLGMTLLTVPLLWLAQQGVVLGMVQAALLLNPLFTAYTGALVYRLGRRLDWRRDTAFATALIFGLATLAWPYTQGFFSDPICGWGLLAALYTLLAYRQTGRKEYLWASGAAWSLTYLTRTVNLVTLPVYLAALYIVIRQRHSPLTIDNSPFTIFLTRQWRPFVSFLLPVVAAGLLSLWWNWLRYGNLWDSGYVETESFSADWLFGLYGLLISPARGFFWYSPALLLIFVGVGWFWRQARWILGTIAAVALIYLLLYSKWYMWHGGYSWGPRFLTPLLPLLALLCGPAWQQWVTERRWGAPGRIVTIGLVILSGAVQWLGMLSPFHLVQDWLATTVTPLFAPETFTRLDLSPLVLQWRYLAPEHWPFAWWRAQAVTGNIDWAGLLAPVASALLGLVLIWRHRQQPEEQPRYNWWYGLLLCVLAVALLVRYQRSLADQTQLALATRVERGEQAGDAILLLQPTQTEQFANVYHGELPTYGLQQGGSLTGSDEGWLERIEARHGRLWVAPGAVLPEQSGWERHLRTHDFLLQETRLSESGGERLALYALARAQAESLVEVGLGTIFGDPAQQGVTVNESNGWIRLNSYGLTTELAPGGALLLALRWESLRPVAYDYHVFVHLINSQGDKLAQRDGQPVQWLRPISTWQPGEEIADHYGLLLPTDLPPGQYTILVGLYDPVNGQRLPLSAGLGNFTVELGPVAVQTP